MTHASAAYLRAERGAPGELQDEVTALIVARAETPKSSLEKLFEEPCDTSHACLWSKRVLVRSLPPARMVGSHVEPDGAPRITPEQDPARVSRENR